MRKILILVLCLMLCSFAAADDLLSVVPVTGDIIPGEAVLLGFTVPAVGTADVYLADENGSRVSVVAEGMTVSAGLNQLYWNGTWQGVPAPAGDWQLTVAMDGETADEPVTIALQGTSAEEEPPVEEASTHDDILFEELPQADAPAEEAPEEDDADADDAVDAIDEIEDEDTVPDEAAAEEKLIVEEELLGDDETGDAPAIIHPDEDTVFTPSYGSPYEPRAEEAGSYWTLPMDITDTEAVWEMLMRPITVVDTGKKDSEKTQLNIYREPDKESQIIGVVTCVSQSVRVLEQGEDWTLIETYSSTFHDNGIGAWNMLVQGYIQTKYLKTTAPDQHLAFVCDKLTQRLYIFRDGELYDTLLISTGLSNERQPYNETRSGEFLMQVPAVGGFKSDALICDLGIRFNDGDLLHEVPHILNADGSKNYKSCEPKLGTRASHGCIRVQRQKTPKGTNMQWIWGNKVKNMKFVIWEDWQGRQMDYPADDMPVYYNPNGGKMYHSAETCYSAKAKTFDPFTYGQLDDEPFASLTRCGYCVAPLRKAEIDAINEEHAPGGDHDPILTAAREKWLAKIGE